MGIVCHCPNGHRVKVKDQQAGKRGLCPTCGAAFRIPQLSRTPDAIQPELPLAQLLPLDPAVVATLPRAVPVGTARAAEAHVVTQPYGVPQHYADPQQHEPTEQHVEPMAAEVEPMAAEVEPVGEPAAVLDLHAAIASRPDLSWRIAYPGGAASEPVDAVTMQEWLAGGQAEGTELVWRADWAAWLPVQEVFPEFFPGA
jgi:hypothetical protein